MTKDEVTPLIVACFYNRSDIASYLIKKGANVNVYSINDNSPLILAVKNNDH